MHKTMFIKCGDDIAQCVIKPEQEPLFIELGFVDHVDKLPEEKPKPTRKPRAKKADAE